MTEDVLVTTRSFAEEI